MCGEAGGHPLPRPATAFWFTRRQLAAQSAALASGRTACRRGIAPQQHYLQGGNASNRMRQGNTSHLHALQMVVVRHATPRLLAAQATTNR